MPANYESRVIQWRADRQIQYNNIKALLLRKKMPPEQVEAETAEMMANWDAVKRRQFAKDGLPPPPDEPLPTDPKPPEPKPYVPKPLRKRPESVETPTALEPSKPGKVDPRGLPRTILVPPLDEPAGAGTADLREVMKELLPPPPVVTSLAEVIKLMTPVEPIVVAPKPKEPEPVSTDAIDTSDFARKKRKAHKEKYRYPRPDREVVDGIKWDRDKNRWRVTHQGRQLGYFPDSRWDEAVECRRKSEAIAAAERDRGPMSLEELERQAEFTGALLKLVGKYKDGLDVRPAMRRVLDGLGVLV